MHSSPLPVEGGNVRSGKLLSLEHAAVVPRGHPVVFLELRAEVLRGEKSGQAGDFLSAQFAFHKKAGGMFDPELFEKLKRRLMEFFREPGGQRGLADLEERGQRFDADLLPEVPDQVFPNLVGEVVGFLGALFQCKTLIEFIDFSGGAHSGGPVRIFLHGVQNALAERGLLLRIADRDALGPVETEGPEQFRKKFPGENV